MQALTEMNNQDLGELLGTLYFLEKVKISADKKKFINELSVQIEQEAFCRSMDDIIIILFYADDDLSAMLADLSDNDKQELLAWFKQYAGEPDGKKISAEGLSKIKECLDSF